jgi:hypothetical protein
MLLTPALTIEGWMTPEELVWLAQTASVATSIVEVGCHLGRSTRVLADNTNGALLCVDDWYGARDAHVQDRDTILPRFINNLNSSASAQASRVTCWRVDHATVTPSLIREQFGSDFYTDFTFIDGDHSYESVIRDISNWLPFLRAGGIISGHDYSASYPGVVRAVTELVPDAVQVTPHAYIWGWRKPTNY